MSVVHVEDNEAVNGNVYNIATGYNALIFVEFTASYMDYRGIFASSAYAAGIVNTTINELKFQQAGIVAFSLSSSGGHLKGTITTPKSCRLRIKSLII